MTTSVGTLRISIIVGGILGGICHVDVALSEMVQIHTPTVQIHTPTLHAPKTPQILTTTTTKVDSKVMQQNQHHKQRLQQLQCGDSMRQIQPLRHRPLQHGRREPDASPGGQVQSVFGPAKSPSRFMEKLYR